MHQHSCVGTLVVVNGNVNQYSYIDLMGGAVLESVEQMFRDRQHPFVFQQDDAPCHRAMAVLTWFENNSRRNMLFSQYAIVSRCKLYQKHLKLPEQGRMRGQTNHMQIN